MSEVCVCQTHTHTSQLNTEPVRFHIVSYKVSQSVACEPTDGAAVNKTWLCDLRAALFTHKLTTQQEAAVAGPHHRGRSQLSNALYSMLFRKSKMQ